MPGSSGEKGYSGRRVGYNHFYSGVKWWCRGGYEPGEGGKPSCTPQGLGRDAFNKQELLLLTFHLFPQGDKGVKGERGERGDRGLRGDPVNAAKASSWFSPHFPLILGSSEKVALAYLNAVWQWQVPWQSKNSEVTCGYHMIPTHQLLLHHIKIPLPCIPLSFYNIFHLKSWVCLKTAAILHLF